MQAGESGGSSRAAAALRPDTARPDLAAQLAFCRLAEELGIAGLLVDIGAGKPDPIVLSAALGLGTSRVALIVACRSGLQSPALLVQQVNTLSALTAGRVVLNVVAGHSPHEQRFYGDFLDHDQRYARTAEFLAVCRAFWRHDRPVDFAGRYFAVENGWIASDFVSPERQWPELLIAGGSPAARDLAVSHGDCWMRLPDAPATLAAESRPVLQAGKSVGLRLSVIGAATRVRALEIAHALRDGVDRTVPERQLERSFAAASDSISFKAIHQAAGSMEWLSPVLWTGLVRSHGAPAVALVGDADEIAAGLLDFRRAGASQFILSGWPKGESMQFFGEHVLPRIRRMEGRVAAE